MILVFLFWLGENTDRDDSKQRKDSRTTWFLHLDSWGTWLFFLIEFWLYKFELVKISLVDLVSLLLFWLQYVYVAAFLFVIFVVGVFLIYDVECRKK